jgi:WS/DGAT/MGAT family acyltransferase
MYQLNPTDASFLHMETDRSPMHVGAVQIVELPEGQTEDEFIEGLRALFLERIDQVPYLTNRLQETPLGLDEPVWVRAESIDMTRHIYRVDVPAPGGMREIEQTVAEIHEQPMDRAHPMWEYAVLCGLPNRRVAYFARQHHACIDGMAAQATTALLADTEPDPRSRELPTPPARNHEGDYSKGDLLANASSHIVKSSVDAMAAGLDVLNALGRLAARAINPAAGFGATFESAPRTRFNRPVSAARSYAMGEMPLADVKAIAKATNATVNDVFLAICGGALRRYFDRTGETPARSMLAGCPVSLRSSTSDLGSNAVGMMKVSLGTDLQDPAVRLAHVKASAAIAKGVMADSAELLSAPTPAVPGLPLVARSLAAMNERLGAAHWAQPPINLIVSNVPGPREQLYSNGGRMLTHYPVSIPAHGNGVNLTVQSYVDGMYFAVTGCAEALPDADNLRDDMLAAFADLCALLPSSVVAIGPSKEVPEDVVDSADEGEGAQPDEDSGRKVA